MPKRQVVHVLRKNEESALKQAILAGFVCKTSRKGKDGDRTVTKSSLGDLTFSHGPAFHDFVGNNDVFAAHLWTVK